MRKKTGATIARTSEEVLAAINAARQPRPRQEIEFVPTRDLVESALAELCCEVLGRTEIGVRDNLFALGCNSLHITQMASRLRSQFGIEIPFTLLLEEPTLAAIAEIVRCKLGVSEATAVSSSGFKQRSMEASGYEGPEWSFAEISPDGGVPLETLVVPTRNRPEALVDCLRGYMRNLRDYGHRCSVIIADAGHKSSVGKVKETVRALGDEFGLPLSYYDPPRRHEFCERLVTLGADRDSVDFALNGIDADRLGASGANRNLLLLLTAGQAFMSVDDDTQCRFAKGDDLQPILKAAREHEGCDPAAVRPFRNRAALLEAVALR